MFGIPRPDEHDIQYRRADDEASANTWKNVLDLIKKHTDTDGFDWKAFVKEASRRSGRNHESREQEFRENGWTTLERRYTTAETVWTKAVTTVNDVIKDSVWDTVLDDSDDKGGWLITVEYICPECGEAANIHPNIGASLIWCSDHGWLVTVHRTRDDVEYQRMTDEQYEEFVKQKIREREEGDSAG